MCGLKSWKTKEEYLIIMKIIGWNMRGAGRKGFINQVKDLVFKYHLDIFVLMETKVNYNKA